MGAVEWFITSVGSFMSLQIILVSTFVATQGAAEWFASSVNSCMSVQITYV